MSIFNKEITKHYQFVSKNFQFFYENFFHVKEAGTNFVLFRVVTHPGKPGNPRKRGWFLEIDLENLENYSFQLFFPEKPGKYFLLVTS